MRSAPSAIALAAALLLAGCSSADSTQPETAAAPAGTQPPASAAPNTASTLASSPPTSVPSGELKVKQVFNYTSPDGKKLTAQVLAHKSPKDVEAAEVRVCNTGTAEISASRGTWVLLYDGGESEHDVDVSGGGLPSPAYPDSFDPKTLTAGKCVRGWINWEAVAGKKPYGVAYKPEGGSAAWKY